MERKRGKRRSNLIKCDQWNNISFATVYPHITTGIEMRRAHIRSLSFFDQVNRNWEAAWSQKVTPWETGKISKPLEVEFEKFFQFSTEPQRALVPGCGSGYDCQYLASKGFSEVIGLDLSQTAIKLCQENVVNSSSNLKFQCANFFEYQNGHFDFIFDYLFFSALDPSMRKQWAHSMQTLLKPNTGVLFTLIFPHVPNSDKSIGPPFHVDLSDYQVRLTTCQALTSSDFSLLWSHSGSK
jgi:methyl halide transferase